MTSRYFELNREKVLETLLYIAARVKNPTFHTIFKIMYFADKRHLSQYGRFISGDSYIAMEYGPVPSAAYDMVKDAREFAVRDGFMVNGYHIEAQRDANHEVLSESDTECLDWAITEYSPKTFGQLTDASHDLAWRQTPENAEMTVESIAATLEDAEALLIFLQNQHP